MNARLLLLAFFLPLLLRCQSRDTQDTKAPRHARERHPKSTNVVTTQARDDGSPFLLFCLGFRGLSQNFWDLFYPLIIKVRCLDITSLQKRFVPFGLHRKRHPRRKEGRHMRPGGGGGVSVGRSGGGKSTTFFLRLLRTVTAGGARERPHRRRRRRRRQAPNSRMSFARGGASAASTSTSASLKSRGRCFRRPNRLEPRSSSPPARYSLP